MKRLMRWLFGESSRAEKARILARLEAMSFEMNGRRYVAMPPDLAAHLLSRL